MSGPPCPSSSADVGGATVVPPPTASHIDASSGRPSSISLIAEVDGYSRRRTKVPGSCTIHMGSYNVGNYHWRVEINPYDGKSSSEAGWVSVYLQLDDHINYLDGETVMAQFCISLLDQDMEPVPAYSQNSGTIRAYASKEQWGYHRFIPGHVVKRYLRDDNSFKLKF